MNDKQPQNCDACGSSRVACGRLDEDVSFEFSDNGNWGYWFTLSDVPRSVSIRQENVRLCLGCGKVTASMKVDLKEAERVLHKWGTEALKSRFNIRPPH